MFTKEWSTNYEGMDIKVVNKWNIEETVEELYINGELKIQNNKNLKEIEKLSEVKSSRMAIEYNNYRIEVVLGSAWHMLGVACKILVDGKKIGGNKIVLFANA